MPTLDSNYAAYLQDLVKKASLVDSEREVFASDSHEYRLNPTISIEEVRKFEAEHNVKLPSEYVFFVTQVGNGGAGPFYGINSLTKNNIMGDTEDVPFISSKVTVESWREKIAQTTEDDFDDDFDDEFDDEFCEGISKEVTRGCFALGTQGCSYETIMLANGPEENRIFYIDFDWFDEYPPFDTGMTFLQWYESFFLEILQGNSTEFYGREIIATQAELIERFGQNTDKKYRLKLLSSFYRFPELNSDTIEFIRSLSDEEFPAEKISLLLTYDLDFGLELYSRYLKEKPYIAIRVSYHLPKKAVENYFNEFLQLLYTLPDGSEICDDESDLTFHESLLYRFMHCPLTKCDDILLFLKLKKDTLTENEIKTALSTIWTTPDKIKAVDVLKDFMLHGSYWVAHAAIQAIFDTNCPELNETYKTLYERYKTDDGCILNNLKIAFESNHLPFPPEQ